MLKVPLTTCSALHAVILFLMSTIESVVIVSLERFACVKLTSPTYGETDQATCVWYVIGS